MTTNINERRIERAMLETMTGIRAHASGTTAMVRLKAADTVGWIIGRAEDYDRARGLDLAQLTAFLEKTQLSSEPDSDRPGESLGSAAPQGFIDRLDGEISRRGVIDVLRHGVRDESRQWDLFYGMRASGPNGSRRYTQNQFSLIPSLACSQGDAEPTVDLCLFVNGLPIATVMLQDGLTKQSMEDAVAWYGRVDASAEPLFQPGRCMAHFAVGEQSAAVCSELRGDESVFWPFNQGASDEAGNPLNLFGIATDYLWRRILTRPGVIEIVEDYAQMGSFPRYHQLEVIRQLVPEIEARGPGRRYLIEHGPGSGTGRTIAWLVRQLLQVRQDGIRIFDSTVVVTDRPTLIHRLDETIPNFAAVSARLEPDEDASARVRDCLEQGVKLIVTGIEQLAPVLDVIGSHQRGRRFALVLDGVSSAPTAQDRINQSLAKRAPLSNASMIAFVSHADEAALEQLGQPYNDRGVTRYRPFHRWG